MSVYGIATETSLGRLFLAGLLPGIMLTALFMAWTLIYCRVKKVDAVIVSRHFTLRERMAGLPRVLPFLAIVLALLSVLYGGGASPSAAGGVGALVGLILVGVVYVRYAGRCGGK